MINKENVIVCGCSMLYPKYRKVNRWQLIDTTRQGVHNLTGLRGLETKRMVNEAKLEH